MKANEDSSHNGVQLDPLPGTRTDSIINDIYRYLAKGRVLTTLDAVISNRTVCLPKYISLLRYTHGVNIRDQWISLSNNKRIKQYWLDVQSNPSN